MKPIEIADITEEPVWVGGEAEPRLKEWWREKFTLPFRWEDCMIQMGGFCHYNGWRVMTDYVKNPDINAYDYYTFRIAVYPPLEKIYETN